MIPLLNRWQFYKDRPGMWQWRKFESDKVVAVSYDIFNSRPACVNDAKTRGYIVPDPKDVFNKPIARRPVIATQIIYLKPCRV